MKFRDIASRITGVSIPIFGVSWTPPESERQIVRQTFLFLEDRRVLFNEFAHEMEREVSDSILAIRRELTEALKRLPEDSEATSAFRSMRAACRAYLDIARPREWGGFRFTTALGSFRAHMGVQIAYLAVKYGVDVDGELAKVLPPELRDGRFLEA